MITLPTVFILGAGASLPYGFPLGRGLRDRVCALGGKARELIGEAGYDLAQYDEFQQRLRYSAYTSVDWFLEDYPEYIEVGKSLIAGSLIPFENEEKLFPPGSPTDHWYELLLNTMDTPRGSFAHNKLSIITFNYDRSLEHYMFRALTVRSCSEEKALDALSSLEVVHVHGTLGEFYPASRTGRRYYPNWSSEEIRAAADQIIIIGEASGSTEEFEKARVLLRDAQRIDFLGFGFHLESVQRLAIFDTSWEDKNNEGVQVGATMVGIPSRERTRICNDVLKNPSVIVSGSSVYRFLSEDRPLINDTQR